MRLFLLLLCLTGFQYSFAQIDYDNLRRRIFNKEDNAYYPHLIRRFTQSDSTLSSADFEAIYYGAVFLDSYIPDKISETEQRIRELNYSQNYIEAYKLSDSLLIEYPASIQAYFEKSFACYNLKRFEEEDYNKRRYKILIRAILNSGDGKSIASAWYANLPNDEFETLKYAGLEIKEETEISYMDDIFDQFTLKNNKLKMKDAFFNVTRQNR